ncbi:hypothetical protein [Acidocella sp.]|uniref:hypothetical protein n=1 Tax=Acidocella sp. TaxID=50710 RepID=UPI001802972A|nr:hypothetical protein [Acidocella sp.]NNM56343.1 hypothetical protein [Acidocella sp.]
MVDEKISWRGHLLALALYTTLSFLLIAHGASPTQTVYGQGSDPFAFIWFLRWWPWAVMHHLNPLYANLIWHPAGIDLAWTTSIPFLALLAAPVTLTGGPVLAYNMLTILAPILAGLSAYALGLYIVKRLVAAILCGLFYGFSTYEMSETLAHLNLDFNAAVPCLLLIVLVRLDSRFNRRWASGLAALLLAMQFYISMEFAATSLLFGGIGWAFALLLLPARRAALRRLVVDGLLTGILTAVLVSPLLWNIFMVPRGVKIPIGWSYLSAGHLYNLFVTTPQVVLSNPNFPATDKNWLGHYPQYDFTTGLPIVVIIFWFLWRNWRKPDTRLLGYMLCVIALASLGPELWIGSHFSGIVMPWHMMLRLPLINSALPVRFTLYTSLLIAIIMVRTVATVPHRSWRAVVVGLAWLVTLASPHPVMRAPFVDFFRPGQMQTVLGLQPHVLILPGAAVDETSFWQAQNHFGFIQSTGYVGMPPLAMVHYAAVIDLMFNLNPPTLASDIDVFCHAVGTNFVLAGPGVRPELERAMVRLSWPSRRVDGVQIFTVPRGGAVHG